MKSSSLPSSGATVIITLSVNSVILFNTSKSNSDTILLLPSSSILNPFLYISNGEKPSLICLSLINFLNLAEAVFDLLYISFPKCIFIPINNFSFSKVSSDSNLFISSLLNLDNILAASNCFNAIFLLSDGSSFIANSMLL